MPRDNISLPSDPDGSPRGSMGIRSIENKNWLPEWSPAEVDFKIR